MALMFGAKIKTKIQTSKYSCTYLCTRHKKSLQSSRLRCTPSTPSKGECFCLFPFCFLSDSRENQPDKSLISVIDNDCYVYPRARALCEEKGL